MGSSVSRKAVIELAEPYAPRRVAPLGIWTLRGWSIKRYSIAYSGAVVRPELAAAAEVAAESILPEPAITESRYGVGFLGVHDGRGGNFVFVDWWEHENELHHHVLFSAAETPEKLRRQSEGDPIACVWDLSIVAHERAAWVRHVLAASDPDVAAYLADMTAGET